MANWAKVSADLESRFAVLSKTENALVLELDNDSRAQSVVITHTALTSGAWISIFSPVCKLDDVAAETLLLAASETIFGTWIVDEFYGLIHSMPIENLDDNELNEPLQLLMQAADRLERKLTGRDDL